MRERKIPYFRHFPFPSSKPVKPQPEGGEGGSGDENRDPISHTSKTAREGGKTPQRINQTHFNKKVGASKRGTKRGSDIAGSGATKNLWEKIPLLALKKKEEKSSPLWHRQSESDIQPGKIHAQKEKKGV